MSTTLVTGASSGIGAELARQLAARGEDLVLCSRRTERLEELRAELLAAHPARRVLVRAMDVDDEESVFGGVRGASAEMGGLDRVVVNAGLGKGAPLGTGRHDANRETAMTNFVGALAQVEAAMEVFREQGRGHLVVVSSMSAVRGMPGAVTAYAATKAALTHLAEGLRLELLGTDIDVTVLQPGYIHSEMNPEGTKAPFIVSTEKGVAPMVDAILARKARANVPGWPWAPLGVVMRHAPLRVLKRLVG